MYNGFYVIKQIGNETHMNFLYTVTGYIANLYCFVSSMIGSVVDIEESEVPETAAAHCTIHWSILCVIAIYGIYAVLRAAYVKRALWSEENSSETQTVAVRKSRKFCHFDTVIGILTLAIICFSKYYWTCAIDYKVAAAGALIVISITVMMEIQNYKLYHRGTC